MAIDKLSMNDLLLDNILGAPPPEDTADKEPIDPQQPDLTRTPDPTNTNTHRQVVGVEFAGGKVYGKATGLYTKHRKYSEQWNPWILFRSAHDLQQAQSFSLQTKTCIDRHLRRRLDHFKIESFHSADTLPRLLSELDCGLSNDSWIEDDSHIIRKLYYRDIFKCIQSLLAHLPHQAHLNFDLLCLADSEGRGSYSKMKTGDCWWDPPDQLPAGATNVPVLCASNKTYLTNFLGNQHAWPQYVIIHNVHKDIRRTPKSASAFLPG
jgi:hypothetical protein